jgi:ribonuclease D
LSEVQLLAEQKDWEDAATRLFGEPYLAVDTESNSLYTYRERICLIQIASRQETFILDPLAVKDLAVLGQLLADPSIVKVLHGSDYDLRSFDRDYGFRVKSLFDTETAARFLGETSPNLASVLEKFLGVNIPKSRKLQRSNWGIRPLNSSAIEYAASDVRHLVRLAGELHERLDCLDRLEWVAEEFQRLEQTRYTQPNQPQVAFLKVKGSDQLSPRGLAVFKELFLWREGAAERLGRPPFRILNNETLLDLAHNLVKNANACPDNTSEVSLPVVYQFDQGIQAAINRGLNGPEVYRPGPAKRDLPWTPESRTRLQRLKQWRTSRGAALCLAPALLWPASSLERLALQPQNWRTEILENGNGEVRAWQRREFGRELMEVLGVKHETSTS